MGRNRSILIEKTCAASKSYIIKDSAKITIGRFFIIDFDEESKKCSIRLKFFRRDNYLLLLKTVESIMRSVYDDRKVNKLNIYVAENVKYSAFLDLGFSLEGILQDNIVIDRFYANELIFGITLEEYLINEQKVPMIKLSGTNIELRNLTPEYKGEVAEYYRRNKNHLKEFEPNREESFYTEEGQHRLLLESYKGFMKGQSIDLGIFKNDKFIGILKLSNIIMGVFKSAMIGYSIDEKEQNNGYMKESVKLACEYAFNDLGLHRIEASAMVSNKGSQRVLEGCGFEKVGINKDYLYINGKWRDHYTYYKINK